MSHSIKILLFGTLTPYPPEWTYFEGLSSLHPVVSLLIVGDLTELDPFVVVLLPHVSHGRASHGRSSIMEQTGGSAVRDSVDRDMAERFDWLTDAYRCFLSGSCPSQRAADLACVIFAGVCVRVAGQDRVYCHDNSVELTCISLSLLENMSSSLMAQSLTAELTSYCLEVLGMFQDTDLMSQLVSVLRLNNT